MALLRCSVSSSVWACCSASARIARATPRWNSSVATASSAFALERIASSSSLARSAGERRGGSGDKNRPCLHPGLF